MCDHQTISPLIPVRLWHRAVRSGCGQHDCHKDELTPYMYGEAQGKRPADKHVLSGRIACRACLPSQQVVPGMGGRGGACPIAGGMGGMGRRKMSCSCVRAACMSLWRCSAPPQKHPAPCLIKLGNPAMSYMVLLNGIWLGIANLYIAKSSCEIGAKLEWGSTPWASGGLRQYTA